MANRDKNKPFWNRGKGYGIFLSEYQGKYALQAGKRTENDDYVDWVFLSKWSKAGGGFVADTKKRPMSVFFGDREATIEALRYFLSALTCPGEPDESEIPF